MTGDSEMKASFADDEGFVDIGQYRKLVRNFIDMRRYQTALFWAEKVSIMSDNDPNDVYWQAQCMFLLKEYHRAAHIIKRQSLHKAHVPCYYLLMESLLEAKEYNEAIQTINTIDIEDIAASTMATTTGDMNSVPNAAGLDDDTKNEILSSICFLKGKVFEAMDNRALAMDHYVQALQKSIFSTEALDALVKHEMLMAWEEKELMQSLPFSQQCSENDEKIIKKLYESKLKKYYESLSPLTNTQQTPISNLTSLNIVNDITEKLKNNRSTEVKINKTLNSKAFTPLQTGILSPANRVLQDWKNSPSYSLQSSLSKITPHDNSRILENSHKNKIGSDCPTGLAVNQCLNRLEKSVDILASEAESLFYDCDYKRCLKTIDELLKCDPYHNGGLTVQIGCLVELKDFNKLFYVAHKLVDLYPDKAISWYAVGCYYDLIGKSDPARRYFSKATSLDRLYGPAWLSYGHSFAKENEHDQAMAAYFKATQLMRGCHLPLLYIGVECGLTKNLELAEKFFYQAMSIAPLDVFVLHELGAIKFEYEYYESAEEVFRTTAEIITSRAKQRSEAISPRWEPLFNNLGHCCRKNKNYQEALKYHQLALGLKPQNPETYTAIGFIYALTGRLEEAIEAFHKSLALNRDSAVTATILKTCIEDLMEENQIIDNICGTEPTTEPPKSPIKRAPTTAQTQSKGNNMKLNVLRLRFDDYDDSPNSDSIDTCYDMSIDM